LGRGGGGVVQELCHRTDPHTTRPSREFHWHVGFTVCQREYKFGACVDGGDREGRVGIIIIMGGAGDGWVL